jgi:hypothetical protein
VLQGNTFGVNRNLFAAGLLSFGGNSLVANNPGVPYGAIVADIAAAAGNVAVVINENRTMLHFLTPARNRFSGAANRVTTQPPSTP